MAEETGLIVALGQWVREAACEQARAWHTLSGDHTLGAQAQLLAHARQSLRLAA